MNNGFGTISWTQIKSALVLGGIMAVLSGASYITGIGNFWAVSGHALVNAVGMSFLVAIVSTIGSLLTTKNGTVAGIRVSDLK